MGQGWSSPYVVASVMIAFGPGWHDGKRIPTSFSSTGMPGVYGERSVYKFGPGKRVESNKYAMDDNEYQRLIEKNITEQELECAVAAHRMEFMVDKSLVGPGSEETKAIREKPLHDITGEDIRILAQHPEEFEDRGHQVLYRRCRPYLLTAFHKNAVTGYYYRAQSDCLFWSSLSYPDWDFHKRLSFGELSESRLASDFQPPLRLEGRKQPTMLYIGSFQNGTDGRHFGHQFPELEVHFFEPSDFHFQKLIRFRTKEEDARESGRHEEFLKEQQTIRSRNPASSSSSPPSSPERESLAYHERYYFHNFGVGRRTKLESLFMAGDGSTTMTEREGDREVITIRSVSESLRAVSLLGDNHHKSFELVHINCEGCEYAVISSFNFATLSVMPHLNIATHTMQSLHGTSREERKARGMARSLSNYCRMQNYLDRTHIRVGGLPFVWERWTRRCHWTNIEFETPPMQVGMCREALQIYNQIADNEASMQANVTAVKDEMHSIPNPDGPLDGLTVVPGEDGGYLRDKTGHFNVEYKTGGDEEVLESVTPSIWWNLTDQFVNFLFEELPETHEEETAQADWELRKQQRTPIVNMYNQTEQDFEEAPPPSLKHERGIFATPMVFDAFLSACGMTACLARDKMNLAGFAYQAYGSSKRCYGIRSTDHFACMPEFAFLFKFHSNAPTARDVAHYKPIMMGM